MNVDHLEKVLRDIRRDLETTQVETRLATLESYLNQQLANPQQVEYQQAFVSELQTLRSSLASAPSRSEGPIWYYLVEQANLYDLAAASLEVRINTAIQENQLTPALLVQSFNRLRAEIAQGRQRVDALLAGLESLTLTPQHIPADKAEVMILIPREAVDNDLNKFGDEAKNLDQLLSTIAEACTGGEFETVEIQSLSTTEIIVTVLISSIAAANFAKAVNLLMGVYAKFGEIQTHSSALKAAGAPKETLEMLDQFAVGTVKEQIVEAVKQIMLPIPKDEKAQQRQHEVRNHLQKQLERLARRLRRGYHFDVEPSDQLSEAEGADDLTDLKKIADQIRELRKTMQQLSIQGEELLELPSDLSNQDDSEGDASGATDL